MNDAAGLLFDDLLAEWAAELDSRLDEHGPKALVADNMLIRANFERELFFVVVWNVADAAGNIILTELHGCFFV